MGNLSLWQRSIQHLREKGRRRRLSGSDRPCGKLAKNLQFVCVSHRSVRFLEWRVVLPVVGTHKLLRWRILTCILREIFMRSLQLISSSQLRLTIIFIGEMSLKSILRISSGSARMMSMIALCDDFRTRQTARARIPKREVRWLPRPQKLWRFFVWQAIFMISASDSEI